MPESHKWECVSNNIGCVSVVVYYITSTPTLQRNENNMNKWNETQPIFLQIRQQLIEMVLNGTISHGEAMPSVRQISTDLSVNPLTVTKAYQSLVDLDVVVKKRGLGMFVEDNARAKLLDHERSKFLKEDWPRIRAQIEALELDQTDLFNKGEGK